VRAAGVRLPQGPPPVRARHCLQPSPDGFFCAEAGENSCMRAIGRSGRSELSENELIEALRPPA